MQYPKEKIWTKTLYLRHTQLHIVPFLAPAIKVFSFVWLGLFFCFMKKSWYAVITADILYSKNLTTRQKLLYAVVGNLSNEKGYCFASNAHFSRMMNCSIRAIQRDLNVLEKAGIIGRVMKLDNNGKVEYRALSPMTNMSPPHDKYVTPPHDKYVMYNNKVFNNKINIPFASFWDTYDKKVGDKFKVKRKWESLSNKDREKIMNVLPEYIEATPDKQFRKHPMTYLNNKGWEDEIIKTKKEKSWGIS